MESIQVFDKLAVEYDNWFEINDLAYQSEILAIQKFIPKNGEGLDIGIGTGRFAIPFGIKFGVEPAPGMAKLARERGITVFDARAEALPFGDGSFDYCMLITVICFLADPLVALKEANRVLRPGGKLIIGMLDRESPLGRIYDAGKDNDQFFRAAKFYSAGEVSKWLENINFHNIEACQTIFANPDYAGQIREGYGEGLFVVLAAMKGESF